MITNNSCIILRTPKRQLSSSSRNKRLCSLTNTNKPSPNAHRKYISRSAHKPSCKNSPLRKNSTSTKSKAVRAVTATPRLPRMVYYSVWGTDMFAPRKKVPLCGVILLGNRDRELPPHSPFPMQGCDMDPGCCKMIFIQVVLCISFSPRAWETMRRGMLLA